MPEIKQNFIKGKMNKDLDERLIPKGEYREAQNVHITESEGSDASAIENVLGNISLTNNHLTSFPTGGSAGPYQVIGYCKDLKKKRVVYFLSNFASTSFTDNIRNINRANGAGTPYYSDNREASGIVLYDIEKKTITTLVAGTWLNLSINHLITGAQIIDDLLFWTDNLNQPRKINIQTALEEGYTYYNCEETISVAKYAPYAPPMLHDDAGNVGQSRIDPAVTSEPVSDYMKERFIRFAYRYKYDDGEYSLISPFTQSIFEPLNKGIITNSFTDDEKNETSDEPEVLTGKKEVYKKGIVDIMQNRINKVVLRIPLPNRNEFATSSPGSTYSNPFHIQEVDILLKESNGISFKLVKTIKISELTSSDIEVYTIKPSSTTYYRQSLKYTYSSAEPFKVLPESEVTRVFDQVPLMAKSLEIVGNRVVFGNYVENYPYPTDASGKKGINYTIDVDIKGAIDQAGTLDTSAPYLNGLKQWMHKTYKYHTVKQRRTYQVGIVFADAFGRQSPVILSSSSEINADTITVPEVTAEHIAHADGAWVNSGNNSGAYGNSLKIAFQDNTLTSDASFAASMANDRYYNPHGWYSYRIVVKQTEQDYYNVYAPHSFDGWNNVTEEPDSTLTGGRSWLALHGDNVNKVPRSLNDTDLNREGTMGSNARLYPKVVFDSRDGGLRTGVRDVGIVTTNPTGIANGTYTITIPSTDVTTSGSGTGAVIDVTVSGGTITEVDVTTPGTAFEKEDTITIASSPFDITNAILTVRFEDIYDTYGESKMNDSYHQLAEVVSLGTAFEQNLFLSGDDNKSGTGGFSVYDFIYGKNKNPLVAEMQNMKAYNGSGNGSAYVFYEATDKTKQTTFNLHSDQLGTNAVISDNQLNGYAMNTASLKHGTIVTVVDSHQSQAAIDLSSTQTVTANDKIVFSKYYEGLSVFETEPFESKIDIYYETSTCGLVKDLIDEITIDQTTLPSDLTIFQDSNATTTYNFGTGQPAFTIASSEPFYGKVAYVYENLASGEDIGDLSATKNASGSSPLTFSVSKVTRTADAADLTGLFTIDNGGGIPKLRTNGTFVFRNNSYDEFTVRIAVNDPDSGTAYLDVYVKVQNSLPSISAASGTTLLRKEAGSGVNVTNGTIENGSQVSGGSPNKYTDLTVTFSFGNASFNDWFSVESEEGTFVLKTNTSWTETNAETFFAASESNRTVTFTVTDNYNTTDTDTVIVNEFTSIVAEGELYRAADVQLVCSASAPATYYITPGTGNDPQEVNNTVEAFVGNVVYTNAAITTRVDAAVLVAYVSQSENYYYVTDANGVITTKSDFEC